jgi:hypothetical protein
MRTLEAIAEPVRSRGRVAPAATEAAILALCSGRYLSAEQIGSLLRRNSESLRHRFLAPMVEKGQLRPRHPKLMNRPDQAYTTVRPERRP